MRRGRRLARRWADGCSRAGPAAASPSQRRGRRSDGRADMATVTAPAAGQRVVLRGIGWQTYTRLLRTFAGHRGVRLTYDRGALEILSPLLEHEGDAAFLGRM